MAGFLDDVEKRFDDMRARSQQRKLQEEAKKRAQQEAAKAAKKNKPSIFF